MAASSTSSQETDNETILEEEEKEEDNFRHAMKLVNGSVLPMAMNAAIQLGVFDILANAGDEAGLSAEEIAARMPTNNPNALAMLKRICRLLADHCVLGHTGFPNRYYCLRPVSKYFVRNEDGVSLAPLMNLVNDEVFLNSGSKLKDAVLEGGVPFNRYHGMSLYEYLGLDARFREVFNTAMFNHTHILVKEILKTYESYEELEKVEKMVDVGGGTGETLGLITSKYPKIKGINFDLPHVIQHAPTFPGVEHVPGDMFESVPEGDAILLKGILHDWSDDCCLKLLENCYNALHIDGTLIVVERINAVMGKSQIDVLMMTQNTGGRERVQAEILRLAARAGFKYPAEYGFFVLNNSVMGFKKQSR